MNDQLPAVPHPFPDSRSDASHWIRGGEDVPGALELFRVGYEQAKEMAERRGASIEKQGFRRPPPSALSSQLLDLG